MNGYDTAVAQLQKLHEEFVGMERIAKFGKVQVAPSAFEKLYLEIQDTLDQLGEPHAKS